MIADDVVLGNGVVIPHPELVNLYGCEIGPNTKIASFVEIQRGVKIGRNVKVEAYAFICSGVTIDDGAFIGPHVCFTNDKHPRAVGPTGQLLAPSEWKIVPTHVEVGASIGAGATILCGITIGAGAMVAAGAIVTESVPPGATVKGQRARKQRETLTFNTSIGPVQLRRGRHGEQAFYAIEDVLKLAALCAERAYPVPHSVTLRAEEFDRLTSTWVPFLKKASP